MNWIKGVIIIGCVFLTFFLIWKIFMLLWRPVYVSHKIRSFRKENETAKAGQVVFFGDSITDMCNIGTYYPQLTAYNRGIAGDTTSNLLERIETSVYDPKPSLVVLLIGINDLELENKPVTEITAKYESILSGIKKNLPDTKVICQSVYPGGDGSRYKIANKNETIKDLNQNISTLANRYGFVYVDVFHILLDEETGAANLKLSKDGLHPNKAGYQLISKFLTPYIKNNF